MDGCDGRDARDGSLVTEILYRSYVQISGPALCAGWTRGRMTRSRWVKNTVCNICAVLCSHERPRAF